MKKLVFIVLTTMVIVSCKKSEIIDPPPLTSPGVTAKISGASIDYGVPTAEKQVSTDGTETIFISASTNDGNSIEVSLSKQGGIAAGSYGASNAAFVGISNGTNYYATGSTVSIKIIAVDDTHVVGSFSGTATDATSGAAKSINEGRFYAVF